MISILHGDNVVKSRQKLVELMDQLKSEGVTIVRLQADKTNRPELESHLSTVNLFNPNRAVVLEELHHVRSKKKKKQLIELINQSELDIILWEKRELTKTMQKKFPKAKIEHFKITNQLFKWLDSFSPLARSKAKQLSLLSQAIQSNDEYMCLAMLARQIRLLIQAKDGGSIKAPPFVVRKINNQARDFSLNQLLHAHQLLAEFDLQIKTSTNQLEPAQYLEWLVYQV